MKLAFKFSSICGKGFEVILYGTSMVKEMVITKVSIRDRLIVDLKVIMSNPRDYDFSPRAEVNGTTLSVTNEGDETLLTTFELNSEMMHIVERDRMVELRI